MDIALNVGTTTVDTRTQYEKSDNEKVNAFYAELTSAAEKSKSHSVGNALSLTMIAYDETISYGMAAFRSDKSTAEDPIIKVSCCYGGEQRYYDVHVKEVNPSNASQMEMFAWCAWADENGITDGGTFGSYNKLKTYGYNASILGEFYDVYDAKNINTKVDWIKMLKRMAEEYLLCPETYEQSLDCNRLADALEKYISKMNMK